MALYSKVQTATKLQQEVVRNVNGVNALWRDYQSNPKKGLNAVSQAIITSYGKILDPGSVVRESEYARTPEGLSLVNKAQGWIEKMQKGGAGLTASDLNEFINAINVLGTNAQKEINSQIQTARAYGDKYGLDTSLMGGQSISGTSGTSETKVVNGITYTKNTQTGLLEDLSRSSSPTSGRLPLISQ
jgi:hypothetical protein